MRDKINIFFRICSLPFVSMAFSAAYIVYNGFFGICYKMIWNGAICAYSLLFTVRSIINYSMRKTYADNEQERKRCKRIVLLTHIIMAMINVALILPIATMIKGGRPYNLGLIPAIAMAAYTTYRIVNYIIHSRSASDNGNLFAKELRTRNLIDICVAILTLQNTMIIANDGEVAGAMKEVSIGSSTVVWFFVLALTVHSFMGIKKYNDEYFEKFERNKYER